MSMSSRMSDRRGEQPPTIIVQMENQRGATALTCSSGKSLENVDRLDSVSAAARDAREVLAQFLTDPTAELSIPPSAEEHRGLTETAVYVMRSPYPRRRVTIAFLPYDNVVEDGGTNERDHCHEAASLHQNSDEVSVASKKNVLVRPCELPACARSKPSVLCHQDLPASALRQCIPRASNGPYAKLSYVMDETCTPFTALLATLRAAGFTRISGRAALLHKTHSLLWVKHLLPSLFDQLLAQKVAYRKANHFLGTHWLGRKDKLCLLLRRAGLRWQARIISKGPQGDEPRTVSAESSHLPSSDTRSASALPIMPWASMTPASWILPQEAEACARAVRASPSTDANPSALSSQRVSPPLFIVKPTNEAGGRGIFLVRGGSEAGVRALMEATNGEVCEPRARRGTAAAAKPVQTNYIVQRYLANPFLIEGRKFDLRLYVVVTSYEPVRLYVYQEGLVRIAASPYIHHGTAVGSSGGGPCGTLADVTDLRAHLTNFTVNKAAFPASGAEASVSGALSAVPAAEIKWPLSSLAAYMEAMGRDWPATLARIHELLRRVFLAVTPEVRAEVEASAMRRARGTSADSSAPPITARPSSKAYCPLDGASPFFEFFGVDVLLTDEVEEASQAHVSRTDGITRSHKNALQPVLLEVNIMPSLSTHYSLLDQRIKANFIADALTLVGLTPPPVSSKSTRTASSTLHNGSLTHPGSREVPAEDDFLKSVKDCELRNLCFAAEEEYERAGGCFTRLLPTADSALEYCSLMMPHDADVALSELDMLLSDWLAYKKAASPHSSHEA